MVLCLAGHSQPGSLSTAHCLVQLPKPPPAAYPACLILLKPRLSQMRRDWFGRSSWGSCNTTDEGEETIYCPNKGCSSKYQAATTLLIPFATTFRSYAAANSDFKLFLPARFGFSIRRGKTKKGLTNCCQQDCWESSQFRHGQSSRTLQVILASITFKNSRTTAFLIRAAQYRAFPGQHRLKPPVEVGLRMSLADPALEPLVLSHTDHCSSASLQIK